MEVSKKIFVVNDLHPIEMQGAATIAYNYHDALMKRHDSSFYCGSKKNSLSTQDREFFLGVDFPDCLLDHRIFRRICSQLSRIIITSSFLIRIIRSRPDFVWFHQMGQRFGFITIVLVKLLGVKTFVTFHDFGGIKKGKLYPHDLSLSNDDVDGWISQQLINNNPIPEFKSFNFRNFLRKNFLKRFIRRFYIRTITKYFADRMLYISNLQKIIYVSFGFEQGCIFPNPIEPCDCALLEVRRYDSTRSALFAGRAIGKGLEKIAGAISSTGFILHLAGKVELLTRAQNYLPHDRIVYHGEVSRQELFRIIHSVDLVCVPSMCFDVYPTITLESLSHGTPVLTHRTCGGTDAFPSNLVYLQAYGGPINLDDFQLSKIDKFTTNTVLEMIIELERMFRELE